MCEDASVHDGGSMIFTKRATCIKSLTAQTRTSPTPPATNQEENIHQPQNAITTQIAHNESPRSDRMQ